MSAGVYHHTVLRRPALSVIALAFLVLAFLLTSCTSTGTSATQPVRLWEPSSLRGLTNSLLGPAKLAGITIDASVVGSARALTLLAKESGPTDVLMADSSSVDTHLERPSAESRISWFVSFGSARLVLAYDNKSIWAVQLKAHPWYTVAGKEGFRLGRTSPTSDSEGGLAAAAVSAAAIQDHQPTLLADLAESRNIHSEQQLVSLLRTQKLDGAVMSANEATLAHLSATPLNTAPEILNFTIAIPSKARDSSAAIAFVRFLLSPAARRAISHSGITLATHFVISGEANDAPESIRQQLRQ